MSIARTNFTNHVMYGCCLAVTAIGVALRGGQNETLQMLLGMGLGGVALVVRLTFGISRPTTSTTTTRWHLYFYSLSYFHSAGLSEFETDGVRRQLASIARRT